MRWTRSDTVAIFAFAVFTLLTTALPLALAVLYGVGQMSTDCAC